MENNIILLSGGGLTRALSNEEEKKLQTVLWQLLAKRTALYTAGESSSVRAETAQELLKSICFCLDLYFRKCGETGKLLITSDPDEVLSFAQKAVIEETENGRRLYAVACSTAPEIENISYKDTLTGIGNFFRRYDSRFFAHNIPCDIDYQLCHGLDDSFLGIEFINEYLRRIIIENNLVCRLDKNLAVSLLENYCADYRGLLINIYEPIAVNTVGLALIGENIRKLNMTDQDRASVLGLFSAMSATPAKKALREAALHVCRELKIEDSSAQRYLQLTAEELYPRIEVALRSGEIGGIFL